jgi:hypothetical protein
MIRLSSFCVAAALAVTFAASGAMAQSLPHRHHVVHHRVAAVRPGDIVVHAGRSYLDPGPPAWYEQGRGASYVDDGTPSDVLNSRDIGPSFGFSGFEVLPSRFNPPGRPEPLFTFTDP